MRMKYTIQFDDNLIDTWLTDNPGKTGQDFYNELNNILYLGGDCLNAIASRLMGLDTHFYIIKLNDDKNFHGEMILDLDKNS